MKKMEFKKLAEKDIAELEKKVAEGKAKLDKLFVEIKSGKEKNVKIAAGIRREIAQMLTLISAKRRTK